MYPYIVASKGQSNNKHDKISAKTTLKNTLALTGNYHDIFG